MKKCLAQAVYWIGRMTVYGLCFLGWFTIISMVGCWGRGQGEHATIWKDFCDGAVGIFWALSVGSGIVGLWLAWDWGRKNRK